MLSSVPLRQRARSLVVTLLVARLDTKFAHSANKKGHEAVFVWWRGMARDMHRHREKGGGDSILHMAIFTSISIA